MKTYLAYTIELEMGGLLWLDHCVIPPHYHHKELQSCNSFLHRSRFHWSGIVDEWEEAGWKGLKYLLQSIFAFIMNHITFGDIRSSVKGVMPVLGWSEHALCRALGSSFKNPTHLEPMEDKLQQKGDVSSKSREQWLSLGREDVCAGCDVRPGQRGSPAMP